MTQVLLGLFSGIAFGYVIQRVGATNPNKMALSHLMKEPYIPQFMVLAVALSAVGLFGLQAAGAGRTMVLPTSLVATGLAAVIFGVGWGLAGYCPGTTWAAVGEGRMDAVFCTAGRFGRRRPLCPSARGFDSAALRAHQPGPNNPADLVR